MSHPDDNPLFCSSPVTMVDASGTVDGTSGSDTSGSCTVSSDLTVTPSIPVDNGSMVFMVSLCVCSMLCDGWRISVRGTSHKSTSSDDVRFAVWLTGNV